MKGNVGTATLTLPAVVYRVFDDDDRLLYVGASCRLEKRLGEHRRQAHWWPLAARIELEHHASLLAARECEPQVIAAECPAFNVEHGNSTRRYPPNLRRSS